MKSKKYIYCIVFSIFWISFCSYAFCQIDSQTGNDAILDKLKDPKQYIEKNNENTNSEKGESPSIEKNNTSTQTNSWFLQHQNIWGTGQISSENEGGKDSSPEASNPPETSWINYFFRTIIALIFVVGLILVLLGGLRYFSRKAYQGVKSIGKIVGVLYLSPRTRIYYVHSAGKVFLLGLSGDQMSLLFTFPEDEFFTAVTSEEITEPSSLPQKTFNKVLDDVETRIQTRASSEKSEVIGDNIDDELASLKANIQRLQKAIREETSNVSDE